MFKPAFEALLRRFTPEKATSWFKVITQKSLIGKTSRRFKELDPEILHRCSLDHYATFDEGGFSTFWLFRRFSGVPDFFGEMPSIQTPLNRKKKKKIENPLRTIFFNDP